MLFATFGPFKVNANIVMKSEDLGSKFNEAKDQLNDASGVYIFVRTTGERLVPIYVGKAQRQSFGSRIAQHLNGSRFANILEDGTTQLSIFLIARVDQNGRLLQAKTDAAEEFEIIDKLEHSLIGACISVSSELMNLHQLKPEDDVYVPGYRDGLGRTTSGTDVSAQKLEKMLKGKG